MKNVIVFALGQARYAVELRWVREVFTLGPVTPVAHAPEAVAGVVNYRGAIMPILDLAVLLGGRSEPERAAAYSGEGAILIQVEDVRAALRVSGVVEVATLREEQGDPLGSALVDSSGVKAPLIDPPALLTRARAAARGGAGGLPPRAPGGRAGRPP
jgi:chemotaxis signal transduction protein